MSGKSKKSTPKSKKSTPKSKKSMPLIGYGKGAPGAAELNSKIEEAWQELLSDPKAKAEAASILGLSAKDLSGIKSAPFEAKPNASGLGPVTLAILIFAGTIAADVAKDLAKDATKAALLTVWSRLIKPRLRPKLPLNALSHEEKVEQAKVEQSKKDKPKKGQSKKDRQRKGEGKKE
jgi:hypothetical protein